MADPVRSPCRNICRLSQDEKICIGCGRTMLEITAWQTMTPAEREVASEAARKRLASI
ncbi:MAG: DUF1289 domain-containing protein [Erythrobacter sp.]|jgi:predicted Fe-S protein YdhL (DUF1289 family)|nr:DUF1289 domain-containing protein [Erythrobacter sp.]